MVKTPTFHSLAVTDIATGTNGSFRTLCSNINFKAAGRHWCVISRGWGDNLDIITSSNGTNWTTVQTMPHFPYGDLDWDAYFDGTYLHVAYGDYSTDSVYYRRCTPNSNGTVTWSAAEQTAAGPTANYSITLAVDSNNKVIIAYQVSSSYVRIIRNANTDGTWSTDSGFPVDLETGTKDAMIRPMTNGKFYICYYKNNSIIYGHVYDSGLGTKETLCTDLYTPETNAYAINTIGDDVYFTYIDSGSAGGVKKRPSSTGVWGSLSPIPKTFSCLSTVNSDDGIYIFDTDNASQFKAWVYFYNGSLSDILNEYDYWADFVQSTVSMNIINNELDFMAFDINEHVTVFTTIEFTETKICYMNVGRFL